MNFLYPQFLFGLSAISIPIIIHLFNLQKPKKILFPNVRFLKNIQETTTNKLKLKHLLILLSRIFFLIFLVLMFAQPFLKGNDSDNMKGKPFMSIYLDNSYSMQNEPEGEKAIDVAVKSVQKLVELYPANTFYGFLSNDFEGKDQYYKNKEKIQERLSEINFSNTYRDANSIAKRQDQVIEKQSTDNNLVFWFSDFQKSTMGDLSKISFDSSRQYFLVPINNSETSNIFIDSLWLSSPLVKPGENNTVEVKLYNEGNRPAKDLTLKLYIDNVQVSAASADIPAKSYFTTQFIFNISGEGQKKCVIRFEDQPITFDNEYYFTLNVSPKIKILHLYEGEGKYVKDVYSNESIFALQSNRVGDFDYSTISNSNLVVLDELKEISTTLANSLKDFVEKGGSLVVYPNAKFDINSYNGFIKSIAGFSVSARKTTDTLGKASSEIIPPDFDNPFFKNIFEKKDGKMNMPFAKSSMGWPNRGVNDLLRFKNDDAFLAKFGLGKGSIYLFASPLEDENTNFHKHSIFVPVMYKMAFNSLVTSEQLAFSFQDPSIVVDMELKDNTSVFSLESEKFKIIPGQRIIGSKLIFDLPKDEMKAGFYDLKLNGETKKIIAVNNGKAESYLSFYTKDELSKITENNKNVKIYDITDSEKFAEKFKSDNIGTPLWKYCLLLALMFLFIEILLIRFL